MPQVTILIPNYKTLALTKLCLRLIRKLTDKNLIHVIVIDNDSQDDSLEYLRSLKWIELIERPKVPSEPVHIAHSKALDLALEQVTTPYVLSIHTDTFVKRPDWLVFLLKHFEENQNLAGVGSWKLEQKPWWHVLFKTFERLGQKLFMHLFKKRYRLAGEGDNYYYLRSHCALYRMDLLKKYQLKFCMEEGIAGKGMHQALVQAGHYMKFLSSEELLPYVDHVNHATMILHPELGASKRSIEKGRKRLLSRLKSVDMEAILRNETLDV